MQYIEDNQGCSDDKTITTLIDSLKSLGKEENAKNQGNDVTIYSNIFKKLDEKVDKLEEKVDENDQNQYYVIRKKRFSDELREYENALVEIYDKLQKNEENLHTKMDEYNRLAKRTSGSKDLLREKFIPFKEVQMCNDDYRKEEGIVALSIVALSDEEKNNEKEKGGKKNYTNLSAVFMGKRLEDKIIKDQMVDKDGKNSQLVNDKKKLLVAFNAFKKYVDGINNMMGQDVQNNNPEDEYGKAKNQRLKKEYDALEVFYLSDLNDFKKKYPDIFIGYDKNQMLEFGFSSFTEDKTRNVRDVENKNNGTEEDKQKYVKLCESEKTRLDGIHAKVNIERKNSNKSSIDFYLPYYLYRSDIESANFYMKSTSESKKVNTKNYDYCI